MAMLVRANPVRRNSRPGAIDRFGLIVVGLLSLAAMASAGPVCCAERAYHTPRNVFGQPDIAGVWSNATFTRLERPLY